MVHVLLHRVTSVMVTRMSAVHPTGGTAAAKSLNRSPTGQRQGSAVRRVVGCDV